MLHLALTLTLLATPSVAQSFAKGNNVEVLLASDSLNDFWGLSDRGADHATTAINNLGDVLVVFHSERTGYLGTTYGLKQVEAALFTYDSAADLWSFKERYLLGSVIHDPLGAPDQDFVKCERPDVIAVDDSFFVVWTRRYDRSFPGQAQEPAVLECAWLTPSGTSYTVHNDNKPDGEGFQLDAGYFVRECAGVPDAVLLDPGSSNSPVSIGIAYARQTNFGDDLEGNDATRVCHLRFITCEIDQSNNLSTPAPPIDLVSNIQFNGDTAPPPGDSSAGLIVPDLARANGDFRFWLAFEEQLSQTNPNPPDGRIRLHLYEQTSPGTVTLVTSHSFGVSSTLFGRRRPNLASNPVDLPGADVVSIAFAKIGSGTNSDPDAVYEQWVHDPNLGLYKLAGGVGYPNDAAGNVPELEEIRPLPVHGVDAPMFRRCYVDRKFPSGTTPLWRITRFDSNVLTDLDDSNLGLGRPAAWFWRNEFQQRNDVALTYEKMVVGPSSNYLRIFLRLD